MADGRVNKCKVCNRRDVQMNRQAKRDYYNLYDSQREKREDRKKAKIKRNIRRKTEHPEKEKAKNKTSNMIRDGKLKRKPCFLCGEPKTQAHHPDYSKPDFVVWLCSTCHAAVHAPERMINRAQNTQPF